jgi:hypothetical protein
MARWKSGEHTLKMALLTSKVLPILSARVHYSDIANKARPDSPNIVITTNALSSNTGYGIIDTMKVGPKRRFVWRGNYLPEKIHLYPEPPTADGLLRSQRRRRTT